MNVTIELLTGSIHTSAALVTIILVAFIKVLIQVIGIDFTNQAETADENFVFVRVLFDVISEFVQGSRKIRAINAHTFVGGVQRFLVEHYFCATIAFEKSLDNIVVYPWIEFGKVALLYNAGNFC